jgi:hypothetical protein
MSVAGVQLMHGDYEPCTNGRKKGPGARLMDWSARAVLADLRSCRVMQTVYAGRGLFIPLLQSIHGPTKTRPFST